jgi:hypothetical protein
MHTLDGAILAEHLTFPHALKCRARVLKRALSTTAALSVILLRGLGLSTSRGPNIGYSAAFLSSQKGALRSLNGSLDLSAAVVLVRVR